MPDDTWIALDFETATADRNSACALGIALIEDGRVTTTRSWLMQPPANEYSFWNTKIHGISAEDTAWAPTFEDLYPQLLPYIEGRDILAHSASFDVSVLRSTLAFYGLPKPKMRYACSCRMARAAFPDLHDHKLPTVCDHCGIRLRHHDAASDALACAHVALKCRDEVHEASVADAIRTLGVRVAVL